MPFKDTKEGSTHHGKDACYNCEKCGEHLWRQGLIQSHLCSKGKKILKEKVDKQ